MSDEMRLLAALLVAAVAAFAFTPVAIRAATHFDFLDKPKGYKGHAAATPYLGGSAVLAAFLVAVLLLAGDWGRTAPIAGGATVLWVVGTVDDRRTVSPALRVAIELSLACMLWATGLGWDLGVGWAVDLAVTCVWVIGVVNAINLFDNMDGASSTMALVVSAAVGALGVINGDAWLAAAGAALAGSCLGFLPYNLARPNARIFLGDGGSMPVGFVVAALVMTGVNDVVAAWQALVLGLMLVGIPALDTTLVIISRRRKGISILTGGRDHLTHRTRRRFDTARPVAFALGASQALMASVVLVAVNGSSAVIVALTGAFLAGAGLIIAYLEREEDRLHEEGELSVPEEAIEKSQARRARRPDPYTVGDPALLALAVGAGASPFFFGLYASKAWVPTGIVVLVVAAMGTIRRPPSLTGRAWAVFAGMAGLGVLSLLSTRWADSVEQATVDGNRWLVLTAVLGLVLVLVRSERRERIAAAGLAAGILAVAAVVLVRMLGGHGSDLFLGGRLNEPLGYINAEATVFLMGAWLALGLVERRRGGVLAGAGMACATWLSGLALLSQSRGAAVAALVSVIVVVAVLPGRTRRLFALITLAAGLLVAQGALLDVFDAQQVTAGGGLGDAAVSHAARVLLLCGAVTGLLWGAASHGFDVVAGEAVRARVRTAGRAVLIAGAVLALVGVVATSGRITDRLDTQWQAFTLKQPAAAATSEVDTGSRLVSGAGNRYEYWRVAWNAFREHPMGGLGAGNYDAAWFIQRRVAEDVRQPHSIQLQTVSELGLPGGLLLLAVIGGLAVGIARIRRIAQPGTTAAGLAVAAVGVVIAWLVHTSVDWQHLIPGVTAIPLIMLGVVLRRRETDGPAWSSHRGASPAALVTLAVVLGTLVTVSGAALIRQGLAEHYRAQAFSAVRTDPRRALEQADRSLRLDAAGMRSYYAKAAALARLDRGAAAEQVLLQATRREPTDPVVWALLGDLASRRALPADARRYYRRALALNPLDPGLRQLAAGQAAGAPR